MSYRIINKMGWLNQVLLEGDELWKQWELWELLDLFSDLLHLAK
ncbi:MAG: hypothetical protein QF745_09970 [Planctomycetota bacterium]|nr:hypothetical protein [Planctomycetota bacterium]